MVTGLFQIGFSWVLFYLAHSILASTYVKQKVNSVLPFMKRWYRLVYNLISVVLFIHALSVQINYKQAYIFTPYIGLDILGLILIILSFAGMFLSFRNYSATDFIGLNDLYRKSEKTSLSVSGLNRYVRHPLYSFTFLFFIGYFLVKPTYSSLIFVLTGMIYLVAGTWFEEKKLIREFGQSYIDYMEKVPKFIPALFRKRISE